MSYLTSPPPEIMETIEFQAYNKVFSSKQVLLKILLKNLLNLKNLTK